MISIYDKTITRVSAVDEYVSFSFQSGWDAPGSFEIVINRNIEQSKDFKVGYFITVDSDGTKAGRIEQISESIDEAGAGSDLIKVKGRELLSILDQRIVYPEAEADYYEMTSNFENVLKTVITAQTQGKRAFSLLELATNQNRGPTYAFSARYKNLLTAINEMAIATGCGVLCSLDTVNKKIVLDCAISADRTSQCLFSTDLETIKSASLTDNALAYKNLAVVAGQGQGRNRTVIETYIEDTEPEDMERKEYFVDARDVKTVGALETRGAQKLSELSYESYLSAEVLEYSNLIYGENYFLGDTVKISQFGITKSVLISAVNESWDDQGYRISLVFDKSLPIITEQMQAISKRGQDVSNTIEIPQELTAESSPTFAGLTVAGYTKNGADAPSKKEKEFEVITGAVGGSGAIAHALSIDKIITASFTIYGDNVTIPESWSVSGDPNNWKLAFYFSLTSLMYTNFGALTGNRRVVFLVTYKE